MGPKKKRSYTPPKSSAIQINEVFLNNGIVKFLEDMIPCFYAEIRLSFF